jgi:hypothetical protein
VPANGSAHRNGNGNGKNGTAAKNGSNGHPAKNGSAAKHCGFPGHGAAEAGP